jgi:type I restriction enzyme S subunit
MTTGLPEGWATIRVGDFFDSWGGMTPSTSNASYWSGDVPWVSSKDVKAWRIGRGEEFITQKALQETRLRLCPVGSVLVVVRSGILAHTLPIAIVDAPVSINQDLKAFYCPDRNLNEWLALALRALGPEILTNNRKDGTTVQSVRYEELCDLTIPVPPNTEQSRIIARLAELLQRVRDARERLARVPAILKRFRQAVLAAACSGRLTEDWRQQHPDTETAAIALGRCQDESNREPNGRRMRRRSAQGLPEVEPVDGLPETWTLQTIKYLVESGAIIDFQDGNHGEFYPRKADFGDVGIKFLTATQVFNNRVLLSDAPLLKLEKAHQLRIGFAKPRDVLLTHNATVGRVGVLPDDAGEVILGTSVTYYRLHPAYIEPNYCCIAMQGDYWQAQLRSVMEQTTRNQVSITKQAEFQLILPPLSEQQEIVRRVQKLFVLADAVEKQIRTATLRAERLAQSILAKTLRGELVPTEAELARREGREYEPASMLLERIKKEREGQPSGKRERRAVRPKTKRATAKGQAV